MVRSKQILILALMLLAPLGCGGSSSASVSGTVSLNGKKLVLGTVNLMSADGHPYQGQIDRDGKYSIEKLPHGKYTVMIHSPDPLPPIPPGTPVKKLTPEMEKRQKELEELRSRWVAIPEKYSSFETSTLSIEVGSHAVATEINLTE
jgi:hypothetical protein